MSKRKKEQVQPSLGGTGEAPQAPPSSPIRVEMVDLSTLQGMENPVRMVESEEAHETIRESIRALGLLQPLLVQERPDGTRVLVAGYRRYQALRELGYKTAPAIIIQGGDALLLSLAENTARENLNPIEEAIAILALVENGARQEAIAAALGRSPTWLSRRLSLLTLEPEVQDMVIKGELSASVAQEITAARTREIQLRVAEVAVHQGLTERATREWVSMLNSAVEMHTEASAAEGSGAQEAVANPPLACLVCGQTHVPLRWVPMCPECLDKERRGV